MTSAAFYVASAAAAGSAIALALRDRRHVPVATMFATGLIADGVAAVAKVFYQGAARPLVGAARAWGHLGQAAFTIYPAVVVAAVYLALRRDRRAGAASLATWGGLQAILIIGYAPLGLREHRLGLVYLGAEVVVVAALAAAVVPWWMGWQRRRRSTPTEAVAVVVACAEALVLMGPMLLGRPWERWGWATAPYAFAYVVATIVQGGALWIGSSKS